MKSLKFLSQSLMTLSLGPILFGNSAHADVIWSGRFRFEGVSIQNPYLDDSKRENSYGLSHLIMDPRIIAADGIEIRSRFHVLNTNLSTSGMNAANQLGQVWGGTSAAGCMGEDCPSSTQAQGVSMMQVSQLYVRWLKDYQEFTIGRAPLHFGLGATYNEGNGMFDHWLTTRDMVAYRIEFGNLWIRPMLAKINEGTPSVEDDMSEILVQGQYDNPTSNISMGIMYAKRFGDPKDSAATGGMFDPALPTTPALPPGNGGWNTQLISIFLDRTLGAFKFGFEAGFLSGKSGYRTSGGAGLDVNLEAYGLLAEMAYDLSPKFKLDAKVGMATGDDPSTADRDETYSFHRNYDVGMLLYNFNMSPSANVFGTNRYTRANAHSFDGETVANTLFIAPGFHWIWNDAWSLKSRFIYGKLMQAPVANMDTALGFEFDTSIIHKPMERLELRLDLGVLAPGKAFEVNGTLKAQTAFGLMTKAAITF